MAFKFKASSDLMKMKRLGFHKKRLEMLLYFRDSLERRLAATEASIATLKKQINEENDKNTNEVSSNDDLKNENEIVQGNDDHESIESVPFISEPVKKKTTKSKKEVS